MSVCGACGGFSGGSGHLAYAHLSRSLTSYRFEGDSEGGTKHDVTKARFPISSKGSDAAVRLSVIPLSRIFHVVPRLDLGAFSLTVSRFMDGLLELSAHLLASL